MKRPRSMDTQFKDVPQTGYCDLWVYRGVWFLSACAYIPTAREVGLIIQDALNKQVKIKVGVAYSACRSTRRHVPKGASEDAALMIQVCLTNRVRIKT